MRAGRSAVSSLRRSVIARSPTPADGLPHVFYGYWRVPTRNAVEVGGIVKLQGLAERFPNSPLGFNILYFVSSRLPDDALQLAQLAKSRGVKLIVNQNGVAYPGWFGHGYERINAPMRELLALADYVLYQSVFCRMCADRFLGPSPGESEVLHNAVDTEVFRPATTPAARPFTLLLGGTQYQWYRVEVALQTLALVRATIRDARLLVSGQLRWPGDRRPLERALTKARDLGIADGVDFLGRYTQADAPALFQRADVLLHTKYNDPCPTTVIEAMASGLPVVYSASGGVPELVGDQAGIGVPAELSFEQDHPPSPEALATAILAVGADRERYARAARVRAVTYFDVRRWLARHDAVFSRLVG